MADLKILLLCVPIFFGTFIIGILFGYFFHYIFEGRSTLRQNQGERSVREIITYHFKAPHYHLLNNITLPDQEGTTQIDHILVSTKGVFVIETKNYSGWIFANEKSRQWTQTFYRVKNKYQNPIHQNFKHVKAIQKQLDFLPKEQIHSIVVFTGSAEFKTPMPKDVLYLYQLVDKIKTYEEDVFSVNRVQFCVGRLECTRYEMTNKTDFEHQAYLYKKFGRL